MKVLIGQLCFLPVAALAENLSKSTNVRRTLPNGRLDKDEHSSAGFVSVIEEQHELTPRKLLFKISNDMLLLDFDDDDDDTTNPIITLTPTSKAPTDGPSMSPTKRPSAAPTVNPSLEPTIQQSSKPSALPSYLSTSEPSLSPSGFPSVAISASPSISSSSEPSVSPTSQPTGMPTTSEPTSNPSYGPSLKPTPAPSSSPVNAPTAQPTTEEPTASPTLAPSSSPVNAPTAQPTTEEPTTAQPTEGPTLAPSSSPVNAPTAQPTTEEPTTAQPTASPTQAPSSSPVNAPTAQPTTEEPTTAQPTASPTQAPSSSPVNPPTASLTTEEPTSSPTLTPSSSPVTQPTASLTTEEPTTSSPTQAQSSSSVAQPTRSPNTNKPVSVSASLTQALSGSSSLGPTKAPPITIVTHSSASPMITPAQSSEFPTQAPSASASVIQSSVSSTSNEPTSVTDTQALSSSPVAQPTRSPNTDKPTAAQSSVSASPTKTPPINMATQSSASPMITPAQSSEFPTQAPSASRSTSHTQATSPLPVERPSASPIIIGEPTTQPTMQSTSKTTPSNSSSADPTDRLSESGLSDATLGIEQFLGSILNQIYNVDGRSLSDYYADINLVAVDQKLVLRDLPNNEPVRHLRQTRRQSEKLRGSEIIYDGTVSFFDTAPSSSGVAKTLIATSTHFNDYLVANITGTGNPELASVYVVYAEKYEEEAGTEVENFLPNNPNGINQAVEENSPEGTKTALIIMTAAGVATLTMLILVFTSRRHQRERSNRDQTTFEVATSFPIRGYPRTDLSVVSSLTEVCAIGSDDNILPVRRNNENNRGQEENVPSESENEKRESLMSVAEINCKGTFSLEKDDGSVLPKTWLKALHADEQSNASLVSTESAYQHQIPELNTNDSARDPSEHGSEDFSNPISPRLLSAFDCGGSRSHNLYTVALSASVIDTVTSKRGGFPTFGRATASKLSIDDMSSSSSDTGNGTMRSASTSASQFIRDLVWLENKIAMENTTKTDLDELERRVSTNTENTDSTNDKESGAMSVACRDCVVPSGTDILDGLDIQTTADGPTVTRVAEESLLQGHLIPGNRIVAVDGVDTKNAPADLVASLLTSTTTPTHKVTVLQFGSNDV
eukprot:scaffold33615_cov101-Skeletonema_dohrnii-CCMP3373.AAC.6